MFFIIGSYGGGSRCKNANCKSSDGIVAGCIIGGVFGSMLLFFGISFVYKCCKGRPLRSNSLYINLAVPKNNYQDTYSGNPFQSGIWSSRYYQYLEWHGPSQLSLTFDSESSKITGSGSDDVGTFTVDGIYSKRTSRIGLKKIYQLGTGNRSENFGHQVILQLEWNVENHQFEGKWYVHTKTYQGVDKFQLHYQNHLDLLVDKH
jgi:hypothetical protein